MLKRDNVKMLNINMGHRKKEEDIKSKIISVRMTEKECNRLYSIVENSGYNSLARFLREEVIRLKIPHKSVVGAIRSDYQDVELIKQLKKIGTNLNQINRVYNSISKNGHTSSNVIDTYLCKSTNVIEQISKILKQFE